MKTGTTGETGNSFIRETREKERGAMVVEKERVNRKGRTKEREKEKAK